MTQIKGVTELEFASERDTSQKAPRQLALSMVAALIKMILKNPSTFRNLRVLDPDEERYVRPPRQYEIPPFRDDMQYCTSNEKYLRPTRWCNPREPEVIAMANELGAYALSDYEFAEAAYWFVKDEIELEMIPFDDVGATLRRGTGTCYHKASARIALCRAAGIKGRYKTFSMLLPKDLQKLAAVEGNRSEQVMAEMWNVGAPEAEGEVYIDGEWTVAHLALRSEMLARMDGPITRLGEDATDLTFDLVPGTIKCFESIPWTVGIAMKAFMWLAAGSMERTNVILQKQALIGRRIIEEAGGIEAYDQNARRRKKELSSIETEITRLTQEVKCQQVVEFEE